MSKETIAAIISNCTMINEEGLVQNAEEVAQAIIDAMGSPAADIGAEIEAAPGHVKGVTLPTDEDLDRQQKAEFDITMDLLWRLRENREKPASLLSTSMPRILASNSKDCWLPRRYNGIRRLPRRFRSSPGLPACRAGHFQPALSVVRKAPRRHCPPA